MSSGKQDTIFAPASGAGPSGIAVIRISGPECRFVVETMCGSIDVERRAYLRQIRSKAGELLDSGIVVVFEKPKSFTGEDSAELHVHGGSAVVDAVCNELGGYDGVRMAEAGEFTMRAFQNGKIDLTESEALADLIDAETEEQRRFALLNTGGAHKALYESWRSKIIDCLAELTAEIDFADEADVEDNLDTKAQTDIRDLVKEIDSHMKRYRNSEIVRKGFRVVIVGRPNVGKSSLLNTLAGRDVAIVTDVAGTTRDVLEIALDLRGRKVVLSDTAGIRKTRDDVEQIGVERAVAAANAADLVLVLSDLSKSSEIDEIPNFDAPTIRIGNKADLNGNRSAGAHDLAISVKRDEGIDELIDLVTREVEHAADPIDVGPFRKRHFLLLTETRDALEEAVSRGNKSIELVAEELRVAADSLGKITGSVDVEDLLDVIFSRFCVGK